MNTTQIDGKGAKEKKKRIGDLDGAAIPREKGKVEDKRFLFCIRKGFLLDTV